MGLANPQIDRALKFSDVIGEDTPFILDGIRIVTANSKEFGKGEMVLLKVRGQSDELGIWGQYLIAQAKSVEPGDLGQRYQITRQMVSNFSERPVKALVPVDQATPPAGPVAPPVVEDDDIPF